MQDDSMESVDFIVGLDHFAFDSGKHAVGAVALTPAATQVLSRRGDVQSAATPDGAQATGSALGGSGAASNGPTPGTSKSRVFNPKRPASSPLEARSQLPSPIANAALLAVCPFMERSPKPHAPPRSRGSGLTVVLAICDVGNTTGVSRRDVGDYDMQDVDIGAMQRDAAPSTGSPNETTLISGEDEGRLVLHASMHHLTLNTSYADTKKFRFTKVFPNTYATDNVMNTMLPVILDSVNGINGFIVVRRLGVCW